MSPLDLLLFGIAAVPLCVTAYKKFVVLPRIRRQLMPGQVAAQPMQSHEWGVVLIRHEQTLELLRPDLEGSRLVYKRSSWPLTNTKPYEARAGFHLEAELLKKLAPLLLGREELVIQKDKLEERLFKMERLRELALVSEENAHYAPILSRAISVIEHNYAKALAVVEEVDRSVKEQLLRLRLEAMAGAFEELWEPDPVTMHILQIKLRESVEQLRREMQATSSLDDAQSYYFGS